MPQASNAETLPDPRLSNNHNTEVNQISNPNRKHDSQQQRKQKRRRSSIAVVR